MVKVKKRTIIFLSLMIVSVFLILGYIAGSWFPLFPTNFTYPLVEEARILLEKYSYYPIPEDIMLERGMIHGLTQSLGDPYSLYLDPVEHELEDANLSGEYGGIGVELHFDLDEKKAYIYPYPGSPAENSGISEGDILLQVEDIILNSEFTLQEVTALLRGPVPSTVEVTIEKASPPHLIETLSIERKTFSIPSVHGYLHPDDADIAVIHIKMFSDRTADELGAVLSDLSERGARAVILDLRGNNGGMLCAAVETASQFLKEGTIVSEIRRDGKMKEFTVNQNGDTWYGPLAILVDEGTASAAEVVAASLQEHKRAVVIGRKTFGKGSVQVVVTLSDESSLHITNAIWKTPEGRSLEGSGIEPDIFINADNSASQDSDMAAAVEWLHNEGLIQ